MREIIITCDAKFSSSMEFGNLRKEALLAIASGKKILWHLDFGLFPELKWPLEHPGQFSSFYLAIDHFKEKLWNEFRKFSVGIALYKGSADLSDAEVNYLLRLADGSKGIPPFVIFDHLPQDLLSKARVTDPTKYGEIKPYFLKESFHWKTHEEKAIGVYMPHFSMTDPKLLSPYQKILEALQGQDFKLIPEDQLVLAWHGLNTLYVYPKAISHSGNRKIQGFVAAGGDLVLIAE